MAEQRETPGPMVVRVAGVPFAVLEAIRCSRAFDAASDLEARRSVLTELAGELCDQLRTEIGQLPAGDVKASAVGLRRALHRGRMPRDREWHDGVAAVLPGDVVRGIKTWLNLAAERDDRERAFAEVFARDTTSAERGLREAVADGHLRRALSLASPALHDDLESWLTRQKWTPKRRTRVQLARYLARAATKTSPFSTFTISGTGVAGRGGRAEAPPVRGVLEFDGLLLDTVVRSVLADPRVARIVPLRTNPSATCHTAEVQFLGRAPAEPVVTVPLTPAVRACLTKLGTGARTVDDLCMALGGGERVAPFLDGLVQIGLLERVSPVPDQAFDQLREWQRWLDAHGVADLAAAVGAVRDCLPPSVAVDGDHRGRRDDLVKAVDTLERVRLVPRGLAGRTAKSVFHENAVFTGPVACEPVSSRDLDVVRRWLAAVDPGAAVRIAMAGFVADRFGPGARVPFLTLHRAVHEELRADHRSVAAEEVARLLNASPFAPPPPLDASPMPRLRELGRIRDTARHALLAAPVVGGAVRPDPARIAAMTAAWPEWLRPPRSVAAYVQDRGMGGLVLNMLHTGHGRGHTRVAHLVEEAGGDTGTFGPRTAATAEFDTTFGTALNRRTRSARTGIDYPFSASVRADADRARLGDLVVAHDRETGCLRLLSGQTDVEPAHLGMMADLLLPPAAKLLTLTFGSTVYTHRTVSPFDSDNTDDHRHGMVFRPRLVLGDLVLRRASWRVPVHLVPVRGSGETDAGHYRRVVAWMLDRGLPARCFARVEDDRAAPSGADGWLAGLARKPVYLDFAVWHLVLGLERLVANGDVAVFEEALPEPGTDPSGRVVEYLVEVSA